VASRQEIEALFERGRIARPGEGRTGTVDLIRALYDLCGAPGMGLSAGAMRLRDLIGAHRHYVLVLVDGMGSELLAENSGCAFLEGATVGHIDSVFPSTTAAALTTLATAQWPGAHGVLSWWLYLHAERLSITSLPFVERFSERPLIEFGVRPESVYHTAGVLARLGREAVTVIGSEFVDSPYTTYAAGGTRREGYTTIAEAIDIASALVGPDAPPRFVYVYLPQFDATCHDRGTRHERSTAVLGAIGGEIERLRRAMGHQARLIVTADHGLVDVPAGARHVLGESDDLVSHLWCPPTGEARVPVFHVRDGHADEFREKFEARYGEWFVLIETAVLEDLGMLGPEPLGDAARDRAGTFMGIAAGIDVLEYLHAGEARSSMAGYHGGLSRRETSVPLIVV
jgi:hypothetical protein